MKLSQKWALALVIMSTPVLQSASQAQKDYQFSVGETATQSREQWAQLTGGEELARGKKVFFSPQPNYHLTKDENDPYDLTDGALSTRADDRVWFQKDAVGWMSIGTTSGVLMVIDLGSEQPVGQIAIRLLGGREQGGLELPSSAEFLASTDGKQYYSLQKTVKLNPSEKAQADMKASFYFPEEGKAYMVPLVCRTAVRARYIALRVTPISALFTDQISVQKAAASAPLKSLQSFPKAQVYTDGFVVMPRHEPFVVTTNIATPNWLTVQDNSGLDASQEKLGFRLELPQGLQILSISQPAFKEIATTKPGTKAYEFQWDGRSGGTEPGVIGPLWVVKKTGAAIPADAKVKMTGLLQGQDSHSVESPLKLVVIPEVPPLKNLDISLAWLGDATEQEWPNFLRDFRKMGFGYISTFPRYFGKDADGNWSAATQKNLQFLQQAREAGYGILYDESAFHVMGDAIEAAQKAGKIDEVEAREIFAQVDGKSSGQINILYRGKYFQDEIKRVAELAALVQPDQVYFDVEFWDEPAAESKKDPRVIEKWKASGKEWNDFATDAGTDMLRTLVTATRAAVPQKKMIVGLYDSDPTHQIYNSVFAWNKIYPGIVDIAQPSLYEQGRAQIVADRIRFDYNAMGNRKIIPWLTAGTYGEFNPKQMEPMVLESILNGARGVTYFWFGDFDPMDFYYHSKALKTLAPFEKLLQAGKPIVYKGDNSALHFSAYGSAKEALLLVGNYGGVAKIKVNVKLPLKGAKSAKLDGKILTIKNNAVALEVPPDGFRLIVIQK